MIQEKLQFTLSSTIRIFVARTVKPQDNTATKTIFMFNIDYS